MLPEHLHAIWTLPPDDADFSSRWRLIKSRFVRALPNNEPLSRTRIERGERGIWQRRFWEHYIRNENEFGHYADYCAINPVKHGLVRRAIDWPYSSFHRDLQRGIYTDDWGTKIDLPGDFGEPWGAIDPDLSGSIAPYRTTPSGTRPGGIRPGQVRGYSALLTPPLPCGRPPVPGGLWPAPA